MSLEDEVKNLVTAVQNQQTSIDSLVRSLGSAPPRRQQQQQQNPPPPANITIPSNITSEIVDQNSRIASSFALMGDAIDRVSKFGESAIGGLNEFGEFGRAKYDIIQDQFGGIADVNKALTETSRKSVEAFDDIYATFYGNQAAMGDLAIQRNGKNLNALTAFYEDASEISGNYMAIRDELAMRQSLKFNEMSQEDVQKLSVMEKGLQISNSKVAEILERQISTTGKASTKVFDEISAYSKSVSEATGVSFQEIAGQVSNIITDVERFGNVQVEEAARIAGALNQLGLSYQGFGGMVDKFMNFDNAAESLGNLTTVFGVHFDAMEMMQLANEDQEEFLYRMREAFLDSGKAVEDMTLAEKKLAAQQMGMSIQDFENFMQEDRIVSDLKSATESADVEKGFQSMTENMKLVNRSGEDMKQFMINKVMDPVSKEAYNTGNAFASMKSNLILNPQKYLPGYQEFAVQSRTIIQSITGTGAFKGAYTGQASMLLAELEQGAQNVKDPLKLREQINKFIKSDSEVTMQEYMSIINSQYGSAEFALSASEKINTQIGQAVSAAGEVLDTQEMQQKIQDGVLIDPAALEGEIKSRFRELDDITKNGLDGTGLRGQSPSKSIGVPIMEGILGGFEYFSSEEGLAIVNSHLSKLDNNVKSFVNDSEKSPVLSSLLSGETKIDVTSNNLIEKLNELSTSSVSAAQEMQKSNKEKTDAIVKLLETFMTSFKDYIDNPKTIENKLEIDGKALASQLMKIKTDGGTSFALVNPGGDSI